MQINDLLRDADAQAQARQWEWLETDGMGGFASGTVSGIRTRRYHAVLLSACRPPAGRLVLVNGFDAMVRTATGAYALTTQRYAPGVDHPDGLSHLDSFELDPWPVWHFQLPDGTRIRQELFVPRGAAVSILTWRLESGAVDVLLEVRPFLSGRDYHALHRENRSFRMSAEIAGQRVTWAPYDGLPKIASFANGSYEHRPDWYRNFLYSEESARGLEDQEDLVCPGAIHFPLGREEAQWLVGMGDQVQRVVDGSASLSEAVTSLRRRERERRRFLGTSWDFAADAYLVDGLRGRTLIAGYPWFLDWGRDTFIALRGLCLARERWTDAREILVAWAGQVSEGMLPNRFPDDGGPAEFNSVDAALWFIVAVHEFLCGVESLPCDAREDGARHEADARVLRGAVIAIVEGYQRGSRHGIRMDSDGLLACGAPGVQLTWMDAKVGDWVVTPRTGKPVEIQALWINALRIASSWHPSLKAWESLARRSFVSRFWNSERESLYDVVDVGHQSGVNDASLRPNQILAVGGLPYAVLEGTMASRVVETVERHLLTPLGLRSLAPDDPSYTPRYEGGVVSRDGSYHQGTVWPWLLGPFVEAWVRVKGDTASARREARRRFLSGLEKHANEAGLGHISEIADAEAPHFPRGCPFQAWSVGEWLRLDRVVLRPSPTPCSPPRRTRSAKEVIRATPAETVHV
ncbi:MAG: glycogen debranching enzyme family protein [Verrucomicrobiales bacterium]|nr:glycogen debranching enzyme family protein [Verrucomicrobiales bacterium]